MYQSIASHTKQIAGVIAQAMTKQQALEALKQLSDPTTKQEVAKALKQSPAAIKQMIESNFVDAAINPIVKNILMAIALLAPAAMANPAQVADLVMKKSPDMMQVLQQAERESKPNPKLIQLEKEISQSKMDESKVIGLLSQYENELGHAGMAKQDRQDKIKSVMQQNKVPSSTQQTVMKTILKSA